MNLTCKIKAFTAFVTLLVIFLTGTPMHGQHNEIGIVLDRSISFINRQQNAIDRTSDYLHQIEMQPVSVWQPDSDRIFVISLDAIPAIVWRGTPAELKKARDDGSWKKWFASRSDFAQCTDVAAGFRLAADQFSPGDPDVHKYLIAFTDLRSEPPLDSVRHCRRPAIGPPADFPWERLHDISIAVLWVPPDGVLMWDRAIAQQGIHDTFHIYSASEAANVEIQPPPKAEHRITAEETADARASVKEFFMHLLIFALVGLVIFVLAIWLLMRFRRPNNKVKPQTQAARPSRPTLERR
jgi:hypothetical protein